MKWNEFIKKWQLRQIKKPASNIITTRPQFVFGVEFHAPVAADPVDQIWTQEFCLRTRDGLNKAVDDFINDYNTLEDFKGKH